METSKFAGRIGKEVLNNTSSLKELALLAAKSKCLESDNMQTVANSLLNRYNDFKEFVSYHFLDLTLEEILFLERQHRRLIDLCAWADHQDFFAMLEFEVLKFTPQK